MIVQNLYSENAIVKICYLSAIDNYRYSGCMTRTSVPSQPTLQKKKEKKIKVSKIENRKIQIKNVLRTLYKKWLVKE